MEAPTPKEKLNILIENENKKYDLSITDTLSTLSININEKDSLIKKEYSKEYTLKELSEFGKFFKMCDSISNVIVSLRETFEYKKPKIKEANNNIELTIVPILTSMGESTLVIPSKSEDYKKIVNDLCEIIKNQANEIKSLQLKVNSLEEKMKKFEESSNFRRILNKDTLIGDIIKTKEQYNLICDWINREKPFKFKLLYKGTTDGDTIEVFHNKCDNQYPTISIIESTDGQIFGGYTTKSWDKNNLKDIPDPDSFLFNLNNTKKYPVSNDKGLMSNYICDFGGKNFHELYLCNQYFSNNGKCDNGNGFNFKNYELSGGKSSFKIKEVEIYKVIEE